MTERIQMDTGVTGADAPEESLAQNPMAQEEEVSERPEWLPEKFNSAEDMAQAYGELESRMGTDPADTSEETQETQETVEEATGLTPEYLAPYSDEFMEHGELSEESYENLEKEAGIPQDIARAYVEGQRALVEQQQNTVFSEVGGQENYNEMVDWAGENFTDVEITSFDNAVDSGDANAVMMAVKGLSARYAQANGTTPNLVQGNAGKDSTSGFQSWQQVSAAMRDPRYSKDPAYRSDVENRLNVSNLKQ
jgi:hypothetical protein